MGIALQQQAPQGDPTGGAGFNGGAQGGDDNVVDADYEVVDDNK